MQAYKWWFSQFLTDESLTTDQRAFMEAIFERARAEIELDILVGVLPASVAHYGDLEGRGFYPGEYGGRCEGAVQATGEALFPAGPMMGDLVLYQKVCVSVTARLDEWLISRSRTSIPTDD